MLKDGDVLLKHTVSGSTVQPGEYVRMKGADTSAQAVGPMYGWMVTAAADALTRVGLVAPETVTLTAGVTKVTAGSHVKLHITCWLAVPQPVNGAPTTGLHVVRLQAPPTPVTAALDTVPLAGETMVKPPVTGPSSPATSDWLTCVRQYILVASWIHSSGRTPL